MNQGVDPDRVRSLNQKPETSGPVLYWMSRDQRVRNNWALLHAREEAHKRRVPLAVAFCLAPEFLLATAWYYRFMLDGLREVEVDLGDKGIPFFLLRGDPLRQLPTCVKHLGAGLVVTDFNPLRLVSHWHSEVTDQLAVPVAQVDAHNVVPCWLASDKQEYVARTIRPKLLRHMARYLTPFPPLRRPTIPWEAAWPENRWDLADRQAGRLTGKSVVRPPRSGEKAALTTLRRFLTKNLTRYDTDRNDPNAGAQSYLSPYLHFGQISAQHVALKVAAADTDTTSRDAFLEQLIVRRELAENFCFYNQNYDRYEGFPAWARRTLEDHAGDSRPNIYSLDQMEAGRTDDPLWNAAQRQMVLTGTMPGYLRMFWAKQILAWTATPEEALRYAIQLNDTHQLDGRDPNGYTGIAWSLGGVHDRPWFERDIFGKIRYMNANGCRRKFDVPHYIASIERLASEGAET